MNIREKAQHMLEYYTDGGVIIADEGEVARKLIEAEKILIELDRYLDFSNPHDDSVCETCGNGFPDASGINQAMQDARVFLNSLEKDGD